MLSEYVTSLADVSFHIVASMYVRFRYSGKKSNAVCSFLAYFCVVFGPPYAPLHYPKCNNDPMSIAIHDREPMKV